ncbi:MAG: DUF4296 domain-containing protein [Ferruginibacter sp.]
MRLFTPILLLTMAVTSCISTDNPMPNDVLSPKKMQAVMADYIRADVYASEFLKQDSTRSDTVENMLMQQAVFKKNGITRQQFYRSYDYYAKHPKHWKPVLDSLQKKSDSANFIPTLN